jgi:ring-1,2-phenylacetyl-CoA epoxidase subunit PaaC
MDLELAIKELLYKIADDQLIIGHRNSEWTGVGPLLEEDIAFSSMAQDKIGHAYTFYKLLHALGESEPDIVAFSRNSEQFHNCKFVELPIGEYDFSLIRHFLFDNAELVRFEALISSEVEELSKIASKLKGEVRYHVMHANSMIKKLGSSNEESIDRLQKSLDTAFGWSMGIFEVSPYEESLIDSGVFVGEEKIKAIWLTRIQEVLDKTNLKLPEISNTEEFMGGRKGRHTKHLQPLLDEMTEVTKIDPGAEW